MSNGEPFTRFCVYIDDILVTGETEIDHLKEFECST